MLLLNYCTLQRAINMKNCTFHFNKLTEISWANINFLTINNENKLNPQYITKAANAIAQKDFSVKIIADILVHNKDKGDAELAGFDYQFFYKDTKIGEGNNINTSTIAIPSGKSSSIPISLIISIQDLIKSDNPLHSTEEAIAFFNNLKKIGKESTDFSIQLRPHLKIGNSIIKTAYIPIAL